MIQYSVGHVCTRESYLTFTIKLCDITLLDKKRKYQQQKIRTLFALNMKKTMLTARGPEGSKSDQLLHTCVGQTQTSEYVVNLF